jgi:hypothetical protein
MSGDVKRSRIQNLLESLVSPVLIVYRCVGCGERQLKLRSVKVGHDRLQARLPRRSVMRTAGTLSGASRLNIDVRCEMERFDRER